MCFGSVGGIGAGAALPTTDHCTPARPKPIRRLAESWSGHSPAGGGWPPEIWRINGRQGRGLPGGDIAYWRGRRRCGRKPTRFGRTPSDGRTCKKNRAARRCWTCRPQKLRPTPATEAARLLVLASRVWTSSTAPSASALGVVGRSGGRGWRAVGPGPDWWCRARSGLDAWIWSGGRAGIGRVAALFRLAEQLDRDERHRRLRALAEGSPPQAENVADFWEWPPGPGFGAGAWQCLATVQEVRGEIGPGRIQC